MSIQGGIWNFDGAPVDSLLVGRMSEAAGLHGPDGEASHIAKSIGMFYRPFYTTPESLLEHQPYLSAKGYAITWDGRLDNGDGLVSRLTDRNALQTDVAVVAAAFDQWGPECLPMLVGEWALVVWDPRNQSLILAKDSMGTRGLFYYRTPNRICWCTVIDPIVKLTNPSWRIDRDFVAGYLMNLPSDSNSPFQGIRSVAAASCVTVKRRQLASKCYWAFDPDKSICYKEDAEYEEHFRQIFQEDVRRRLRCQSPVLAELSGGLDSSSIVCIADLLIAEEPRFPRLDTISYFDDEEPNWNERPYFERVEQKRGRPGCHVSAVPRAPLAPLSESRSYLLPGVTESSILFETERADCMRSQGNRVLLSGIGGDEVLGGVPTPVPELADLIVRMRISGFASRVRQWGLARKQPWLHLAAKSLRAAVEHTLRLDRLRGHTEDIPWLDPGFEEARAKETSGMPYFRPTGCLPSQASFLRTMARLRGQLAHLAPPLVVAHEVRYPYLDRDLCEFLLSIPREQILRPGQRRSLMRRAMAGNVPREILERRRKAFVVRRYMTLYGESWPVLKDCFTSSLCQSLRLIDDRKLLGALTSVIHGEQSHLVPLARTIAIELWLRSLDSQGLFADGKSRDAGGDSKQFLSQDIRVG